MSWRRGIVVGGLVWAASFLPAADSPLRPDSRTSEKLAGGEDRTYSLALAPDHTLELRVVERQAMAGVLSALAADGRELASADMSQRTASSDVLLVPPGTAHIRVRAANHSQVERVFDLQISELHAVGEGKRARIAAERLLGEGERAFAAKAAGYPKAALGYYEQSLTLWEKMADGRRQADTLCHIGMAHYQAGEMNPALSAYRRAEELFTAENDLPGEAAALYGMSLVSGDMPHQTDAEKWANQALAMRREQGDVKGQPEVLLELFSVALIKGDHDRARSVAEEALSLAQQSGERIREADANNMLGVLDAQLGNHKETVARYTRYLEIARDEHDPVRTSQALSNLGVEQLHMGNLREALRYLEETLPMRKAVGSPNNYANTVYNIGTTHAGLGDYDQALKEYDQALELFRKTHSAYGEGFVLREIGNTYVDSGRPEKAEKYFHEAADVWHSISDRRGEILALDSLAELAMRREQFTQTHRLLDQALAIARAAGLRREQAQTLRISAMACLKAGKAGDALAPVSEALELAGKISDRMEEAQALRWQGAALCRLGRYDDARNALHRAVALNEESGFTTGEADALEELARVERDSHRLDEARSRIGQALELTERIRPAARSVDARVRFTAAHRSRFDLAIDIAMQQGDMEGAFQLSERGHARGLADMLRETGVDIRRGVDRSLLERERSVQELLNSQQNRLDRLLSAPQSAAGIAEARAAVDELVDQYQAVEAEIRKRSPRYAALLEPRALAAREVQSRLLDSTTALLEFWLGQDHSYGWLLTPTECRGFRLPGRSEIEALARRAHQALNARNLDAQESPERRQERVAAADAEFARTAAQLSRILFGPVAGRIRAARLWVVSDGALEYVPFSALPLPGTPDPLVTGHTLARLPSASVLAEVRQEQEGRKPAARGVLIFADPVFRADDERVTGAGGLSRLTPTDPFHLQRLYFSRQEADAIGALAPPGTVRELLDFDASRTAADGPLAANYRVVHFATHAFVDSQHPELSSIVLSLVDRSGQPQDGFLRLHEIYNLQLKADLVVLSGCQTALGEEVRGEGLVGLTRGFMYAGAPQVLASLWGVRDRSTAEFMRRFYQALLEQRLPPDAALRAAQADMRRDPRWAQPYDWAAFIVQGAR